MLYNNNFISADVKDYLRDLSIIVDSLSIRLNLNGNPTQTCESIVHSIKSFESRVISSSLAYNDKAVILASSSIGRHSICNYLDCINRTDTRWDDMLVSRFGDTLDIKSDDLTTKMWIVIGADWAAVGNADLSGAAGGVAFGVVYGWLTGTLTPLVVAATGAAAGVGCSVQELARQILNREAILFYLPYI